MSKLLLCCWGVTLYAGAMISVDESSNGREVVLQTGQALKITLNENASTGFRWMIVGKPEVLRESKEETAEGPKCPPGKGGVRTFYFEVVRFGSGELELEYRRNWENAAKPARTFKILVRVNK